MGIVLADHQPEPFTPQNADADDAANLAEGFAQWAELTGWTPQDLGEAVRNAVGCSASDSHDSLAAQIAFLIGSCGATAARDELIDHVPDNPRPLHAVSRLRSAMHDGYDDSLVNSVLGPISLATGVRLVCLWDKHDGFGFHGDSNFYIATVDGRLLELQGGMWRWLNGEPDDPDTPHFPDPPDKWPGASTPMTIHGLAQHDGLHNYATNDLQTPERMW
ncbi:hypothetical protein ABZ897_50675 [Nonomuraea sp. NPDC046802]|uniref:hypothetical protein n=1 Tax=Nonomuraea sp. NPDC046802 TaxID=3154919 RepID=UPI003405EA17